MLVTLCFRATSVPSDLTRLLAGIGRKKVDRRFTLYRLPAPDLFDNLPAPDNPRITAGLPMSFRGVIPPIITPFHEDGSIDRDGFVAVLEHLIAAGVHGIIIGGTTGEYYAQSRDERVGLLKLASATARGRVPLIAGVGAIRTEDCIDYALVARDLKFDGILVGSPYYAVPTQLELANHALAIDRAAGMPIMLYNYPGRTGTHMDTEFLDRVGRSRNFCAIKEFERQHQSPPCPGARLPAYRSFLRHGRPGPGVFRLGR